MSDSEVIVGGPGLPQPNTYNPIMTSNVLPGMAVAASAAADDHAVLGNNTAAATRQVIGIIVGPGGDAGQRVPARYAGPVVLTTAEWDAVAGTTGGLARNTWYYLSAATAGHITATPNANAAVGFAISATCLIVSLKQVPPTS